ncbi:MAG TPA: hypothetical protein DHN33_00545, partial [Eubacteriaceae bacterium]|nr:hypothetical protein [Eubacteriaceae bacterium]
GPPSQCIHAQPSSFSGMYMDGTKRLSKGDEEFSTFFIQSSFATYAIADERNTVKIDKDVEIEMMGPLGCGIQTGAGTVLNTLKPEPGSAFAVFGCGAVGLSALMAAKLSGCSTIIGVDTVESRLELAKELGATHVINGKTCPDVVGEIKRITQTGVDCSIDTTGVVEVVLNALNGLKIMGTCAIVAASGDKEFPINLQDVVMTHGKKLVGVIEGDTIPKLFIPKLNRFYKEGRFPIDKLVKYYKFEDINQAFQDSADGLTVKPIVKWD